MDEKEFVDQVLRLARERGLRVETNRSGLEQITFNETSRKALHTGHVARLFPEALAPGLTPRQFNALLRSIAPGRPCTQKGMREIVDAIEKR
ncbi:hypothetical protein [Caballeronia temeraria]|uniref:hypothetical protein n=1 Tax=Caballeronia temeraria TaxID=1777137 RepID=UPI0012FD8731|nr:hypothetical protein [Caballeronia temeraria]